MAPPEPILVVDGDGLGRPIARRLTRAGHAATLLTPDPSRWADPHVDERLGSLEAVEPAAWAIVVHCGWPPPATLRSVNRVVVLAPPEAAVDRPPPGTVVRVAPVVGRQLGDRALARLAGIVAELDGDEAVQVVHVDDVARVVAAACRGVFTGAVGLAAPGVVPAAALARALGMRRPKGTVVVPALDTAALAGFGLVPAWSASEAVDDLAMAAEGARVRPGGVARRPGRARFRLDLPGPEEPPADGRPLRHCAPAAERGEFDTPIDPRFPTYSAVNLSEALPGPATPLSLSTVGRGTAAGPTAFIDLVDIGGVLGTEAWARGQAVLAHRVHVNISFAVALARITPGMDVEAMADQFVGRSAGHVPLTGEEPPPDETPRGLGAARLVGRIGRRTAVLLAAHARESERYIAHVRRLETLAGDPVQLDGDRLEDVSHLAQDLQVLGWVLGGRNVLAIQALLHPAGRLSPAAMAAGGGGAGEGLAPLASAAPLLGLRELAALARRIPAVTDVLRSGGDDLAGRAAAASPEFGRHLERALRVFGHRGPGEGELANPRFADAPDLLLRAVAAALDAPVLDPAAPVAPLRPHGLRARLAARLIRRAARAQVVRERCRDHLTRVMAVQRSLAREQGRRLVEAGVLATTDDVFFLTLEELFRPPPGAGAVVARRRAERARLAALRLPGIISSTWSATGGEGPAPLSAGDRLAGLGASAGRAKGRVRLVTLDTVGDFEPGEVLVAGVTDVGYTPLFECAAAVVTDVGGAMSHAAVVAREYGIPAVVDTGRATSGLRDGMVVEVDGSAGTVVVVEM